MTNTFTVPLKNVRMIDADHVGRKASVLGTLLEAGFPVLPGLCLTTAAFRLALQPKLPVLHAILGKHDLRQPAESTKAARAIGQVLATLTVPAQIAAEIEMQLPAHIGDATMLAVRSSSTLEDEDAASFAGQYTSVLGVIRTQLSEAILAVWRSNYSPHALLARSKQGGLFLDEAMAVLIQPMLEAECGGVCYSIDPVTQCHDRMVINAAWGLSAGVADGHMPVDTVWLRRHGFRLERHHVSEKTEQMVLDPTGGIQRAAIPRPQARAACLPESWSQRIAQFGLAAEVLLGKPQDLEWAISDQQVWVLQSRPIPGLPPSSAADFPVVWQDERDRRYLWTLTEYSQGSLPPRPLEHDDVAVVESIREEACNWLGADRNETIQIWNGRAYYRPIPLSLSEAERQVRRNAHQDLQQRLQRQGLTAWDYWGPEIIKATERLREFDLETAGGRELAAQLEQALAVRRRHAMLHPMLWFRPPQSFKDTLAAVSGLTGKELTTTAYQLLDGEETPLTRLVDALFSLAVTARQAPEVAFLLLDPPSTLLDELATLPAGQRLLSQLKDFLGQYGDRTGNGYGSEATIMTPTWREQPAQVLSLVAAYLEPDVETPAGARLRARQEGEAGLQAIIEACNDEEQVAEFRRQLAYARKSFTTLELHNHYIDQMALGQLRQVVIAASSWLCDRGTLSAVDDIFWLRFEEIGAALRGESVSAVMELINQRKKQWAAWAKLEAPLILGTPSAELPPRPSWTDQVTLTPAVEDHLLLGLGASIGRCHGRARVIAKGMALPELEPGDILVAENAGPLWTPWFPILGGLILDTGSLGQHAAATAREYGLPAIVGTRIATLVIPDQAWLTMDGSTGVVEIESS